jgi:hypothetical protein
MKKRKFYDVFVIFTSGTYRISYYYGTLNDLINTAKAITGYSVLQSITYKNRKF